MEAERGPLKDYYIMYKASSMSFPVSLEWRGKVPPLVHVGRCALVRRPLRGPDDGFFCGGAQG